MPNLKRTQMYFPEDLLTELKRKADQDGTTLSHVVRVAVTDFMRKDRMKDWEKDALWGMVGSSTSKDKDLSVNHDKYLYENKK
jgi:hypothetical protein